MKGESTNLDPNLLENLRLPGIRSHALNELRKGRGWIVFHHFRKAAGTTINVLILDLIKSLTGEIPEHKGRKIDFTNLKNDNGIWWTAGDINYYHQEWGAFPVSCLVDPNETPAVLITSIRDPISRYISEFNYTGPGSSSIKIKDSDRESVWKDWIDQGYDTRSTGIQKGKYIDNFYIRSLIGDSHTESKKQYRKDRPPFFGSLKSGQQPFGGGCPIPKYSLNREHLQLAKQVISSFDIIFITEHLNKLKVNKVLKDLELIAPEGSINLMWKNRKSVGRGIPEVPPKILSLLIEQNELDLELYEYTKKLTSLSKE